MEKKICYVVGAGSGFIPFSKNDGDILIAADGGIDYLNKIGAVPDLTVGDFDSARSLPEWGEVVRLKKEKDDTDTLAALRMGMDRGYENFVILGGTGGRSSHTLANIQCLKFLSERDCVGRLIGENFEMTAITDGVLEFPADKKGYISVLSLSDTARGVYLFGLKFPLINATLKNSFPLGVSNEFTGVVSSVRVEEGTLLIITEA